MPLPRALGAFNRRVTNRVTGRLAGRVAPLALVEHRGRRSGRHYRTPVLAFSAAGSTVIALMYGDDVDWLRNVRAAGSCRLYRAGAWHDLAHPELLRGADGLRLMPILIRPLLRLLRVNRFLRLREAKGRAARV